MDKGDVLVACLNSQLEHNRGNPELGKKILAKAFNEMLSEGVPAEEATQTFRETLPIVTRELGEDYV
jgi:hypothetical protein